MPLDLAVPLIGRGCVVHGTAARGFVPVTCECGDPRLLMVPLVGTATCPNCSGQFVLAEYSSKLGADGQVTTTINVGRLGSIAPAPKNFSLRKID